MCIVHGTYIGIGIYTYISFSFFFLFVLQFSAQFYPHLVAAYMIILTVYGLRKMFIPFVVSYIQFSVETTTTKFEI